MQTTTSATLAASTTLPAAALALPDFDMHRVEESLKTNHRLFNGTALTDEEIDAGIQQYREFLARHKGAGMPEDFESPTQLVDRVWHTHMCETKQYADDCISYFGRMLHHSNRTCDMKQTARQLELQ